MPATNVVPRIEIVKEKGAEKVESYVWLRGERVHKLQAAVAATRISAN